MDLFSTPMKLNYRGEDTFRTEFGGLMFLAVAIVCLFFTVVNQFPDGLVFNKPITFYGLNDNLETAPSLFSYTDEWLTFYLYNKDLSREANATEYAFVFNKLTILNVKNGVHSFMDVSSDCSKGVACLKKSDLNAKAKIQTLSDLK